jgi:DNA-binding CsgD family transcriptional regulator
MKQAQTSQSQSQSRRRLRLRDVRDVFRLIGEIRELGGDPKVWRPHMVKRLSHLFGAQIVISSEVHALTTKRPPQMRIIDLGWGCDAEGNVWDIHSERNDENLEAWWLTKSEKTTASPPPDQASGAGAEDEPVEGLEVPVKPLKPVYGGRSFVMSQYPLPHINAVDQLGLHRAFGDESFTPTEHKLVRLFHVELGRLWRKDVLKKAKDPTSDLPPRLTQTLDELLAGLSEKEIAAKLDLSRHTIHNYVKALHQRFEVSSRGELLAKAGAAKKPDFMPKLSITLPRGDRSGSKKD